MPCPFGGSPGAWLNLHPSAPPARGYRVISGSVWWRLMFWRWRGYLALSQFGTHVTAPFLAPRGALGIYFTDRQSLMGLQGPSDFAVRVALSRQAQAESQMYGCAVLEFDVPSHPGVILPPPHPGSQHGFTPRGAREWLAQGNIPLDDTMTVTYIDVTSSGPRWFNVPL
jgi:hypothetical protein